jgi:RNA polymerase sigma-70 factor (ECF subfamily)
MQNRADAEDCYQNIFLKLYKNNPTFNDEEHVRAWLITVTTNECRNMQKSFWRRHMVSIDEVILAVEDEYKREVVKEVISLPERYRDIIYLHYYEGYKVSELSRMLKQKENTIKSRLLRGRELLKARLLEGGYDCE